MYVNGGKMNISFFNREYVMRRYKPGGTEYTDSKISIHLHPMEHGSGPWPEQQGIVRQLAGHGMVGLLEADLVAGTKADRVLYSGRWYECVSSVLYDHTSLSHYNYSFVAVPEEAIEVITLFNAVLDSATGYDIYVPTVITGVAWVEEDVATTDMIGIKSARKFTLRIPEDADFSGKSYVPPASFVGASGTFTLQNGDLIINGSETEVAVPAVLKEKYRDVMTILGVYDFRKAPNARHWKVVGE